MLELKYSHIGDLAPKLRHVLDEFSRQNHLHIELVQIDWENAWPDILRWSLYEHGPDISHIGSTWGASLVGMNALRPFSPDDIRVAGGEQAFLPHCWQSGLSTEKDKVWSLPWHGYTFLISYRRDLLEKAGIDEKAAFQSAQSLSETIAKLKEKISENPWVVPVSQQHPATLHYVASWVWGAGGDFITPDGRQVAFLEPVTLDAICSYHSLLRSMTPVALPLDHGDALNIFLDGKAAVGIVGSGTAYNWMLDQQMSPEMCEKVGFAPIPGTPWVGGDNIVIWKNALISSERERAAVALAQHLVSLETQRALTQGDDVALPTRSEATGKNIRDRALAVTLPTRFEAFNALPMQNTPLTDSIIYSLRNGRSYRPMSTWAKIEYRFAHVFGQIGAEILAGADVNATVRKHLEAHARWLEIVLQ